MVTIAGTAYGIEPLDLNDLDDSIMKQILSIVKQKGDKYSELTPYIEELIN